MTLIFILQLLSCTFEVGQTQFDEVTCVDCDIPLTVDDALQLDGQDGLTVTNITEVIDLEAAEKEYKKSKQKKSSSSYAGGCHSHIICVLVLIPMTFDALFAVAHAADSMVNLQQTVHKIEVRHKEELTMEALYTKDGDFLSAKTYSEAGSTTYLRHPVACQKNKAEVRMTSRNDSNGKVIETADPSAYFVQQLRSMLDSDNEPPLDTVKCLSRSWGSILSYNPDTFESSEAGLAEFEQAISGYSDSGKEAAILSACDKGGFGWLSDDDELHKSIPPLCSRLLTTQYTAMTYEPAMKILETRGGLHFDDPSPWAESLLSAHLTRACQSGVDAGPLKSVLVGDKMRRSPFQKLTSQHVETCKNKDIKSLLEAIQIPQTGEADLDAWLVQAYQSGIGMAIASLAENNDHSMLFTLLGLDEAEGSARAIDTLYRSDFVPKQNTHFEALIQAALTAERHPADRARIVHLLRRGEAAHRSAISKVLSALSPETLDSDQQQVLQGMAAVFGGKPEVEAFYKASGSSSLGVIQSMACKGAAVKVATNGIADLVKEGKDLLPIKSTKAPWEWRPVVPHSSPFSLTVHFVTTCAWKDPETGKVRHNAPDFLSRPEVMAEIKSHDDFTAWLLTQFDCGGQLGEQCLDTPLALYEMSASE